MDAGLKEAFVAIVPLCEIELGCEPLALRQANVEPDAFVGKEKNRKGCWEESGTQEIRKPEGSAVTESFQK